MTDKNPSGTSHLSRRSLLKAGLAAGAVAGAAGAARAAGDPAITHSCPGF